MLLVGLVASGGVSAGTTVLSHVIISHCASSRASRAQGAATIHNTETGGRGERDAFIHTVLTSQLREARDDATSYPAS